jgi:hypothetical protein
MNERQLQRALRAFVAPDEEAARERTGRVLAAAYAERETLPQRSRFPLRLAVVAAVLALLAAALLSPPGQAVLDSVRGAIGIEHAQPALFSLPAPGSLMVASPESGAWVVHSDGSKRRLGDYREASWSPFGRFVVAARANELAALTPQGEVRWTLARPAVRFPRWGGSATDTRVAYLSRSRLHVVAGDGTGDAAVSELPVAAAVAPAWQPALVDGGRLLAFADTHGRVYAYAPDSGSLRFRTNPGPIPSKLEWSADGRRLLVVTSTGLRMYDLKGRVVFRADTPEATRDVDATFLPGGHDAVVVSVHGQQSDVVALTPRRVLFRTTGTLSQIVASPDGRWLLLAWPTADQWVFVSVHGRRRVRAVSNIAAQLNGVPEIGGWCCASGR